jgi:small GTP-binding protein
MNIDINFDLSIAILFLGDSLVGKSNMIYRFTENKYSGELLTSIGFDIKTKIIKIMNKNILVKIYDTAGQERFNAITTSLFQKIQGIILVYDISNEESFKNINYWISKINDNLFNIQCILAGNKCDLEKERIISKKDGENLAKQNNFKFFETSSKTGHNINEIIYEIVRDIYINDNIRDKNKTKKFVSLNDSYYSNNSEFEKKQKCKKCC